MDINVRIKRLQLNITGDNEFYQKEKSEKEEKQDTFADCSEDPIEIQDITKYQSIRRSTVFDHNDNSPGAKNHKQKFIPESNSDD